VSGGEPEHEAGQVPVCVRPEDEVKVIRHQAVRQTPNGDPSLRFTDEVQERAIVAWTVEQRQSANTSIENMEHKPASSLSQALRHPAM
jgi:hypothetical protein